MPKIYKSHKFNAYWHWASFCPQDVPRTFRRHSVEIPQHFRFISCCKLCGHLYSSKSASHYQILHNRLLLKSGKNKNPLISTFFGFLAHLSAGNSMDIPQDFRWTVRRISMRYRKRKRKHIIYIITIVIIYMCVDRGGKQ